jgi:steroid delta-isomerase-like uncharacterized protein
VTPDFLSAEQVARRYYDLFNRRRFDEAEQLLDSSALFHYPQTNEHLIGRAGYRELARMWLTAFPDLQVEIRELRVTDDHLIQARLVARGTHKGPLQFNEVDLPATGRQVEFAFEHTLDCHHGHITHVWLRFDIQKLLRELEE